MEDTVFHGRHRFSTRSQSFFHQIYLASNCISRFVRVLYKIRNPHCRQRTGSPPLITFLAPQSPQRYSTPRIIGIPAGVVLESASAGVDIILANDSILLLFRKKIV